MDWTLSSLYAYTYILPTSTVIIGVSVGLIKFSEYIQGMCISNTHLIIRQSDQIHFLLNRLIDLNKKIVRLENEIKTLYESSTSLSTSLSTIDEVDLEEDIVDVEEEKQVEVSEEVFELIDKRLSPVTTANKKSGWLSFLF